MADGGASSWSTYLQEQTQFILDILKEHPWTSLGVAAGTALLWSYVSARRNLPPGPSGLPWLGVMSTLSEDLPKKCLGWREKYGEVLSYYRCGQLYIILNSERTIREAFVKRGEEFANRANLKAITDLGFTDEFSAAPYNDAWKKNKKFALSALKNYGFATKKAEAKLHEHLQQLQAYLLKTKGEPVDLVETLTPVCAGVVYSILLGGQPTRDDPNITQLVSIVAKWYEQFMITLFATMLYDDVLHPMLANIFTRKSKQDVRNAVALMDDFLIAKIQKIAEDVTEREADSFADAYLKEKGCSSQTMRMLANTITTILGDGIDTNTTVDALCWIHMANNQKDQERAQDEILAVCGGGRMTCLSDRQEMPFCQAIVYESLRLALSLPNSLPRIIQQDTELDGFRFPKGAFVIANYYAVHFDPKVFPDPFTFNPSRYIDKDGQLNNNLASKIYTFSIGNRMCIGEAFVKSHVFLLLTNTLQHFTVTFDPSKPTPEFENTAFAYSKTRDVQLCFKAK